MSEQQQQRQGRRWRAKQRQERPDQGEREAREQAKRRERLERRDARRAAAPPAVPGQPGKVRPPARPRPVGLPIPASYVAADWAALVNICRQPRAAFRFALAVPGVRLVAGRPPAGLPPAGEGGRWLFLPGGALLLRREPGRVAGLTDLEREALEVGPFLLRRIAPLSAATTARREEARAVLAARRAQRGTGGPGLAAVPNEGRAMRFGPRLVLSVSGAFVKQRREQLREVGRRATWGTARQRTKGGPVPAGVHEFGPEWLAHALNQRTREMEAAGEFAWCEVGQLRSWDATAYGVMVDALTRTGWKSREAGEWAAANVRPWGKARRTAGEREAQRRAKAAPQPFKARPQPARLSELMKRRRG